MTSTDASGRALRYLLWGGAISAVTLGLALYHAASSDGYEPLWTAAGWLVAAGIGLVAGFWMNRVHGRAGAAFIVALGTCMLARLFAAAAVGGAATMAGRIAIWSFVVGLAAGFIPLQVLEVGWFHVLTKRLAAGSSDVESGMNVRRKA